MPEEEKKFTQVFATCAKCKHQYTVNVEHNVTLYTECPQCKNEVCFRICDKHPAKIVEKKK